MVSKTSYNPKRKPPQKDSLIIMEKTYAPEVNEDNIIARVAAQLGDTVGIKNGKVLVNDEEYVTGDGIKGNVIIRVWPISEFKFLNSR